MKTILYCLCCALLAASPCVQAHPDEVVRIVNRLRAPGGACASKAPPLRSHGALDATAARLARGAALEGALKSEAYRMTAVQVISLSGRGLHDRLEALLGGRYCPQIGAPTFSDLGVYEAGDQLWIVLAAPFAPQVALPRQQVTAHLLALVNAARAQPRRCGGTPFGSAQPLQWNASLESAASRHATDMAEHNYFSHTGRDGSTPAQRVTRAGYRYRMTGENIAAGQQSPDEAVAGWISSPAHCANLMNDLYTEMGVAFAVNATSNMGVYWVQLFGTRR